jgi:hypothetical protein
MDRPIFGGCHPNVVRTLLDADARRTPKTRAWNQAVWWARVHDCEEVLALARTWTSHTTGDKVMTAGGMVKDALGLRSPKDVFEGRPATPERSRP